VVQVEVMTDNQRASAYIRALGGASNLLSVGACTTRLRLDMVDRNKAVDADLKALGAMAVVRPGNGGSLQVVVGPMADSIADEIRLAMPSFVASAPMSVAPVDKPVAVNVQEAEKWLNALGGRGNVRQLEAVAMTRLRVELGGTRHRRMKCGSWRIFDSLTAKTRNPLGQFGRRVFCCL
jgi:PTS system N-acetylglucosamine-specific IIC component